MRNRIKTGLLIIGIITGSILLGTILLIFVYTLPTNEMKNNAQRSTAIYDQEGVYPQLMAGYKMSQLDNCTDATMILNAIYPGSGSVIQDAMNVYRIEYSNRHPVGSLTDYANDVKAENYTVAYPRYWHGYLVPLKVLLLFFDVADIRIFNMMVLIVLGLYILNEMIRRGLKQYIPWFVVALFIVNPIVLPVSFQFSTITYITIFASIVALKRDSWDFDNCILFFLLIGIMTAYFDFLTFPLVGLYFPMIIILVKQREWIEATKTVILGSISWIFGYVCMWGGKIFVGSILTGKNIFLDVLSRAGEYVGVEEVSRIQIIFKNIAVLVKWPIVFLGIIVCVRLVTLVINGKINKKLELGWGLPFGLICMAPFVWYMCAGTHSYIHYWYTYRELSVAILAFMVGVQKIVEDRNTNEV